MLLGMYIQHWVHLLGNQNFCPSDLKIPKREYRHVGRKQKTQEEQFCQGRAQCLEIYAQCRMGQLEV